MFEVLMRDHIIKQIQLYDLPKSKDEPSIKRRKRTFYDQDASHSGISILSSCIVPKVRGHTSFLTFATLLPKIVIKVIESYQ